MARPPTPSFFRPLTSLSFLPFLLPFLVPLLVPFLVPFLLSSLSLCASMVGVSYACMSSAFIAMAWLPKATVQAALASIPLDLIEEYKGDEPKYVGWGEDIITVAVMSIVLTAPLGVIIINGLGPRWLTQDGPKDDGRHKTVTRMHANSI